MKMRAAALVACLMMAAASPARAEGYFSPFIGFNFGGDSANCLSATSCEDRRLNVGASLAKRSGVVGIEEDIGYAPDFFGKTGEGNAVLTVMTSLTLGVPAGPIRPYGLIGIGLVRSHATFNNLAFDQNTIGYDIGGGVDVFFAKSIAVRGDIRHIKTLQDVTLGVFGSQPLDFWRASAGLTFAF